MAGPLAGISAAEIAKQKLPEQAQQQAKQSPSKFDQALKSKAPDQAQQASQVAQVQHAQKVDQIKQLDKTRLDKIQTQAQSTTSSNQHNTKTDPVTQKAEVSKSTSAINGLFANIEKGQVQMDKLISGGLSGKNFSNSELLALQAGMYKDAK